MKTTFHLKHLDGDLAGFSVEFSRVAEDRVEVLLSNSRGTDTQRSVVSLHDLKDAQNTSGVKFGPNVSFVYDIDRDCYRIGYASAKGPMYVDADVFDVVLERLEID